MPDPKDYEDEKEWMAACVPVRLEEGDDRDQAVAACMGMWRNKKSMGDGHFIADFKENEVKVGSRHNVADRGRIRKIRSLTNELEPNDVDVEPEQPEGEVTELPPFPSGKDETLVAQGQAVKALGDGRIGGYLISFGDDKSPDLEGDYFTKSTDFGDADSAPVYYGHGLDRTLGRRRFGRASHKVDEFGVWAETQIALRDEYERWLYAQAEAGKLAWSSGTATHLVERELTGQSWHIKSWPLGLDDSLTLTPAEPRNTVIPLKNLSVTPSLMEFATRAEAVGDTAHLEVKEVTEMKSTRENKLEGIQMEMTEEKLAELLGSAVKQGVEEAMKALPEIKPAVGVQVVQDEADKPFESLGEQLRAVKNWEITKGGEFDPRLKRLEAKVQNELVGSEGGFLVQQDFAETLLTPIHEVGPFSMRARKLPIGNNANSGAINGVDETSRVTGSRWGGVRGYRLAEGVLKTASDFSFRRIEWRLKKYAVLVVATDELLEDQTQLQAVIQAGASEELNFMLNDDMFRGDGIGGPLGYLLAPALVTVAKEAAQLADTILAENIIKMYSRMYSRSMTNAVWYINQDVLPQLFTMAVPVGLGGTPMYMPPGGLSASPYATLLGRPVIVNEFSSTLGDLGDITFADMSEYLWWEKSGVQAASSIHIYFLYDKSAFRFVYRVDGMPSWGSPLTPFKGSNTTSPFIALAARA